MLCWKLPTEITENEQKFWELTVCNIKKPDQKQPGISHFFRYTSFWHASQVYFVYLNQICPPSLFLRTQNNMGSFFTSLCLLLILVVQNCFCNVILLQNLFARVESLEEEGASKDKRIGVLELKIEYLTQSRVCERITVNHFYWITLDSGINIALRLLIFWLFSRGYGLIPDSIEPIWVV